VFDSLIAALMRRVRGREIAISPHISAFSVLTNMYEKGFFPLLRGLFIRPLLGTVRGTFFLGRGVTLINKGHLHLGSGVYIGNYSYLDCLSIGGVTLGDRVTIREGCWLQLTSSYANPGTSIKIGNDVYIGPRMTLGAAAPIVIGSRCQFGANISLIAENHKFSGDGEIFQQGVVQKGISIGDDVWIGNSAIILDGVTIGDGVVIGAGSVVTKSVPSRSVVVGVPGRVIKTR
jgi:acetyltransferase-like isoleucine patch superfamily enzyme